MSSMPTIVFATCLSSILLVACKPAVDSPAASSSPPTPAETPEPVQSSLQDTHEDGQERGTDPVAGAPADQNAKLIHAAGSMAAATVECGLRTQAEVDQIRAANRLSQVDNRISGADYDRLFNDGFTQAKAAFQDAATRASACGQLTQMEEQARKALGQ